MLKDEKYLVEENTILDFFRGQTELFHLFDDASKLALSVASEAELFFLSKQSDENEDAFSISRDFCSQLEKLPVTTELSEKFCQLKILAAEKKLNADDNKIWTAATAIFYKIPLVSSDKLYDNFAGLERIDYEAIADFFN